MQATTVCFLLRLFTSDKLFRLQRGGQLTDVLGGLLKGSFFFSFPIFSLSYTASASFHCFCQLTTCHNQGCPSARLNSNPSHAPTRLFLLSFPVIMDLTASSVIHPAPLLISCLYLHQVTSSSYHLPCMSRRRPGLALWRCPGLFERKKRASEMSLMVVR